MTRSTIIPHVPTSIITEYIIHNRLHDNSVSFLDTCSTMKEGVNGNHLSVIVFPKTRGDHLVDLSCDCLDDENVIK